MTKPTQGPFRRDGQSVTGPYGLTIAFCGRSSIFGSGYSYSINNTEAIANAQLFAAAPGLLEALEDIVASGSVLFGLNEESLRLHASAIIAIAHAKGVTK